MHLKHCWLIPTDIIFYKGTLHPVGILIIGGRDDPHQRAREKFNPFSTDLYKFLHLVLHVSFVIVQKYNFTEKGSARSTCCIISAFWLKVAYTCFIPDEKHYIFKRGADFEWVHPAGEVFVKPHWTTCKCELSFLSLEHSRQSLKHIFLQVIGLKEKHMGFLFYCLFVPLLKRSSTSVTQH